MIVTCVRESALCTALFFNYINEFLALEIYYFWISYSFYSNQGILDNLQGMKAGLKFSIVGSWIEIPA